jgi:hypothetical protein
MKPKTINPSPLTLEPHTLDCHLGPHSLHPQTRVHDRPGNRSGDWYRQETHLLSAPVLSNTNFVAY